MTVCPDCGRAVPQGAVFCNTCGRRLPAARGSAPAPRTRRMRPILLVALLVAVAAVSALAATIIAKRQGTPPVQTPGAPAASSSVGATSVAPTPSSVAPTMAPAVVHMNLAQLAEPVAGSVNTGEYTMRTRPYYNSIEMKTWKSPNGPWFDHSTQSVEYNVPRGFDTFHATIGMDDRSGSSARTTFRIVDPVSGRYLYGGPGHLVTLRMNQVRRVHLHLPSGLLRIRLTTISHASKDDWGPLGDRPGVHPVWGDAELTGPEGIAVLPLADQ